ncbi:MAG: amidase [Chloroflexi bacterium]|nr:MAG: amidase [Chloroflexota bacterium]
MSDLLFASAGELAELIHSREASALEVVEAHLRRIEAVNPALNAVTQMAHDARTQAQRADADLAKGIIHSPLHGVPFTVKDVFETAGLASLLDVQLRRRRPPTADATCVARLRQAGAILLAKTNCPPNGSGSDSENALVGRTLNPYHLDHTPGGSSGGEAALIAVGASPFGLGSDTSGGVRIPAHYCGLAALKPTSGSVPNSGAYNQPGGLTDPRTQTGLLARRVQDLALLLPIIAGPDYMDSGVVPMPWRDPGVVEPKALTVAFFEEDPASPVGQEVARAVGSAAQALARAGVTVEPARPRDLVEMSREIDYHWRDLAGTPGRTVVEFYALWDDFRTQMLQFMARYDAILCPVSHQPAPPFRERDPRRFDYTVPFNLTGYPAAAVRVATGAGGLPIGVQIVARPWREDVALALAQLLETAFGGWQSSTL